MQKLELLAPARDAATAIEALRHGADAVYMGASAFGARSAAGNTVDDIAAVCRYAHRFGAKVYVTVNTIIYDHELADAGRLVWQLYRAGVDALIVQDMALLRMNLPPIALHASTQCDTRNPEKAEFLEKAGFSQLVLARELSLDEIRQVRRATTVPLEVFVHGALCVSYSGDCHAGALTMGRSANRGECPQICRLRYRLSDSDGRPVAPGGHWLSLRDMNRLDRLGDLAEAGATSFKIEGRLKDAAYVKEVVAAYSQALDALVASDPARWCRASYGRVEYYFDADPSKAFNRGFTDYFLDGRPVAAAAGKMASWQTPKWLGQRIGSVRWVEQGGRSLLLDTDAAISNGDGIVWFGSDGRLSGARVNRAEGRRLQLATKAGLTPGTAVYRNLDYAREQRMAGATAVRYISVDFTLRRSTDGRLVLDARDGSGLAVTVAMEAGLQPARTPQQEHHRRTLGKLGGDIYRLGDFGDLIGDCFVPLSQLTGLRRRATDALDRARRLRHRPELRRREDTSAFYPADRKDRNGKGALTYHANVANRLSRDFYRSHGVGDIEPAVEVKAPVGETVVMTTRYCLRRELGQCIREGAKPGSWVLKAGGGNICLRADFDCSRCGMRIVRS